MSEIIKQQDSITIKPQADVVASSANAFRGELKGLIEEGTPQVVVDLDGVEMMDSVGLGVFIAAHNSLTQTGRVLTVCNASSDIMTLFRTMRLDKHFAITAVAEEVTI